VKEARHITVILLLLTNVVLDLTISNLAGSRSGDNSFFGLQNNMPGETNGVNTQQCCQLL